MNRDKWISADELKEQYKNKPHSNYPFQEDYLEMVAVDKYGEKCKNIDSLKLEIGKDVDIKLIPGTNNNKITCKRTLKLEAKGNAKIDDILIKSKFFTYSMRIEDRVAFPQIVWKGDIFNIT